MFFNHKLPMIIIYMPTYSDIPENLLIDERVQCTIIVIIFILFFVLIFWYNYILLLLTDNLKFMEIFYVNIKLSNLCNKYQLI